MEHPTTTILLARKGTQTQGAARVGDNHRLARLLILAVGYGDLSLNGSSQAIRNIANTRACLLVKYSF
jgi:hypothetical protein